VPPGGSPRAALEQAVFIRDGFHIGAFVFSGLWLLAKRLWLAFALFAVLWGVIAVGGRWIGFNPTALALAQVIIALYLGFEAPAIQERTLLRRGWRHAGMVEGKELDLVQRRFFEDALASAPASPAPASNPMPFVAPTAPRDGAAGVLGMFPDAFPGARGR
jgi:hypothetical protein